MLEKIKFNDDDTLYVGELKDDECVFDYVEYPDVVEPVEIIRITPRKK